MFRARCVPNMYLFGTFSAQNPPKNRAIAAAFPHARRHAGGSGEWLPRFGARGARAWRVEEYGHPAARNATEGACRAKKRHFCAKPG
jgi:hypothetical protein